ncbi:MAG: hypothetical protein PCFJNLEI_04220 [Verrucomicrobiae bacterium]|nr:hypothetical protein [Verrucomicrobiae bacterium]
MAPPSQFKLLSVSVPTLLVPNPPEITAPLVMVIPMGTAELMNPVPVSQALLRTRRPFWKLWVPPTVFRLA